MDNYELGYEYSPDTEAAKVAKNGSDLLSSYVRNRTEVTNISGLDADVKTYIRRVREGSIVFELYDRVENFGQEKINNISIFLTRCRHTIAQAASLDDIEEAKSTFNELVKFGRKEFSKSKSNYSLEPVFKAYLKFRNSNKNLRASEAAYISDGAGRLIMSKPKENFKLEMLVDPILSIDETYSITRLKIKHPDFSGGVDWVFIDGNTDIGITISNLTFYNAFNAEEIQIHPGDVITALIRTKCTKMANGKENKQRFLEAILGVFTIKTGVFNEYDNRFVDKKSQEIISTINI